MFEKELEYFIANQEKLVAEHGNKTLVIKDCQVVDVCDSPLTAYLKAQEKYEVGTFMIQPCIPGPSAYTVSIATQEIFTNK